MRWPEWPPRKVPCDPRCHRRASVAAPASWAPFEVVEAAVRAAQPGAYQGVGFVLSAGDPFVALDLDHCIEVSADPLGADPPGPIRGHRLDTKPRPEGGSEADAVAAWARGPVDELSSYTEVTPSGRGLRIIVRGSLPPHGRRRGPPRGV